MNFVMLLSVIGIQSQWAQYTHVLTFKIQKPQLMDYFIKIASILRI